MGKNRFTVVSVKRFILILLFINHFIIYMYYNCRPTFPHSCISLGKGNRRKKINKWDYIKLKIFCTPKETINKMKRQPTGWENMFTHGISDKKSISNIYK